MVYGYLQLSLEADKIMIQKVHKMLSTPFKMDTSGNDTKCLRVTSVF